MIKKTIWFSDCTATCTGNECADAGLNCPNGEKCVTDPCCRAKCEGMNLEKPLSSLVF